MQRDSDEYKKFQRAWKLAQSEEWTEYLKPVLEYFANKQLPKINSSDAAFEASRLQGDTSRARAIIDEVEYDAKRFTEIKITS